MWRSTTVLAPGTGQRSADSAWADMVTVAWPGPGPGVMVPPCQARSSDDQVRSTGSLSGSLVVALTTKLTVWSGAVTANDSVPGSATATVGGRSRVVTNRCDTSLLSSRSSPSVWAGSASIRTRYSL